LKRPPQSALTHGRGCPFAASWRFYFAEVFMSKKDKSEPHQELRKEARKQMEKGAVTPGYDAEAVEVVRLLNQALATEWVCVLRYRRHYFMARGIHAHTVAPEFLLHSNEELGHADSLAARIVQLGGAPELAPQGLEARSHLEYTPGTSLYSMIREDLVAERIAIRSYREAIQFLGNSDSTTSDLFKRILAVEEEHADELSSLLTGMPQD